MARKLLVIVASTRPTRIGRGFADWLVDYAREHTDYEVELADLAQIDLPLMDEPKHPRFGDYQHEHTKAWSRTVAAADAFVIVTPEYNHSFPATIKNALDYLSAEWRDKPVGFLSYGGVSGGLRAVAGLKPIVSALGMPSPAAGITVPFAQQYVGADGRVELPEQVAAGAKPMFAEMERVGALLRPDAG